MTKFRVWAPNVETVALQLSEKQVPLQPEAQGWWQVDVPDAGPGTDYAYVLDGGEPLPDPRSPWQPSGVHGFSRVVDHNAFPWTDDDWRAPPLASAVIYELHVGTFTSEGTFEAIIEKLDYLLDLGVTHIELMPVNEFPGSRGWGYDGVDLYAPHHTYGGPEGLKRLVNTCHEKNLAVLLDVVYNHLGPDGNYLSQYGPYFTDWYNTPWGDAVNMDGPGSDEVRRFFLDNALMWLRDYHIDGLRLDAVHAIIDNSAIHFLEQLASEVKELERQLGRHLVLIAESNLNNPRLVQGQNIGGYGLNAQWSDDFHHALHTVLTGEQGGYYVDFGTVADVAKALQNVFVYDGQYAAYRGRRHGRPVIGLTGDRFLGYLQNHDQIGNRAQGDRLTQVISTEYLKIGAALVLAAPFVPMLFQGEEWGATTPFLYFTDHQDPDLGRAVSEGRQHEFEAFGWDPETVPDPQSPQSFEHSKLDWSELEQEPHKTLLEWHRRLIQLRREQPVLRDGRMDQVKVQFSEEDGWLVMKREQVTLACNLADLPQNVPLYGAADNGRTVLLASTSEAALSGNAVHLPAESVVILKDKT